MIGSSNTNAVIVGPCLMLVQAQVILQCRVHQLVAIYRLLCCDSRSVSRLGSDLNFGYTSSKEGKITKVNTSALPYYSGMTVWLFYKARCISLQQFVCHCAVVVSPCLMLVRNVIQDCALMTPQHFTSMRGMHGNTIGRRARGRALYPWRLAHRIGFYGNNLVTRLVREAN